jgi:hypothetical protein
VPAAAGWLLDPRDSDTVPAINRVLDAGVDVGRVRAQDSDGEGRPGWLHVPSWGRDALAAAAADLGVRPVPATAEPTIGLRLRKPRVGLFDVYGGHMPTGWDLWVLEQYGFAVQRVWGGRIVQGDLRADFDVLVFHTGLPGGRDLARMGRGGGRDPEDLAKLQAALPPFEDWSDLEARTVRLTGENSLEHLQQFVAQGGTLIAFEGECDKVIRHWNLPIETGTHVIGADGQERRTRREEFYIPGSLVAIEVDTAHPLAAGTSPQCAAMFNNDSVVMEVIDPGAGVEVVARYRKVDTLVSGWAVGEEHLAGKVAVASVKVGRGRIHLYGADVTYRGQPVGTFKLVFHGILGAATE